jgi:hypothetical protein
MTLLTIFTVPKPFTHPHIDMIQRNTVRALKQLEPDVETLLIGEEEVMAEVAAEYSVRHITNVARNLSGTPLVSSAFALARENSTSPLLACINADILMLPEFVLVIRQVVTQSKGFLAIGQRWDVDITQPLDFSPGWEGRLRADILRRGRLCGPTCIDCFVFPRTCFTDVPPFAYGRSGWDNWMVFRARWQHLDVVDLTSSVVIGHQNHDYGHLPGGKPHYRLPESQENIRMGGGRRTLFRIPDATCQVINGRLRRVPLRWRKFWREVEIFPLVHLHSFVLAEALFGIFHPKRAIWEWRQRWGPKLRRYLKRGR